MKNTSLFFLFIILSSGFLFSQSKDFQEGFIVTLDRDTIHGKWSEEYVSWEGIRLRFLGNFEREGDLEQEIITANDILAYGRGTDYLRESIEMELKNEKGDTVLRKMFLNCFIKGELSLYAFEESREGNEFFIFSEQRGLEKLYDKKEVRVINDKQYATGGKQYKPIMIRLMGDCYDPNHKLENLGFLKKTIIAAVADYHICSGKEFIRYSQKRPPIRYFGARLKYVPAFEIWTSSLLSRNLATVYEGGTNFTFGFVYLRSLFNNPSIFLNYTLDFAIPQIDNETAYTFVSEISVRKAFVLRNSDIFIQGGARLGRVLYLPEKEKSIRLGLMNGLLLEMGYGLNLGKKTRLEVNTGLLQLLASRRGQRRIEFGVSILRR